MTSINAPSLELCHRLPWELLSGENDCLKHNTDCKKGPVWKAEMWKWPGVWMGKGLSGKQKWYPFAIKRENKFLNYPSINVFLSGQGLQGHPGDYRQQKNQFDNTDITKIASLLSTVMICFVFGQVGLGKHCRPTSESPRSESDQGLHCLPFCLHLLDS